MKQTKISIDSQEQTFRLPSELHFPATVTNITIRAMGNERILAPAENTWDSFFLNAELVSDDFMSEDDRVGID